MRTLLTLSILFLVVSFSFGQDATIYGKLTDKEGNPVVSANIFVQGQSQFTTYSGLDGRYKLDVPANQNLVIIYSYIGKSTSESVNLKLNQQLEKNITLNITTSLGTADVEGEREGDRGGGLNKIDVRVFAGVPSVGGGIEALLAQAFVQQRNELSSSYSVRGGSFDENLVYVNDIEVYRPFLVRAGQQEGLSFPNPDMVSSINFSAGGFEAKYGDKMSSVLDIKYKKPTEFGGSFSASLLGTSLQLEGTSKDADKKFTHNTGFRYRNNSYVLGSLDVEGDYRPRYADLQSLLTYEVSPSLELNFLGNYSRNRYNFVPTTRETNTGTISEALRLTVAFNGQEISSFETYFGAFSANWAASEFTTLKFIASAFNTYEEEELDVEGRYRLDELDRDLGSDEFGDVLRNRGVGEFIEHARNELNANVFAFNHKGYHKKENSPHFWQWGLKLQHEQIQDKLSEWNLVDSSGFATPHPPDFFVQFVDSIGIDGQPVIGTDGSIIRVPTIANYGDREIAVSRVIKGQNSLQSNRITAYLQDIWTFKTANESEIGINLGVRGHYWDYNKQFVGGPRINATYKPSWYDKKIIARGEKDTTNVLKKDLVFRLAGGLYWQPPFYKELRNLSGSLEQDVFAQRAIHAVLGVDYLFQAWNRPFKLIGEVYYKDLDQLIPYELDNVRILYYGTNNSKGYAQGVDAMVNGEFIKGIQSWVRLSYLKTEEDLIDDFYEELYNADGERIIPGVTFDQTATDTVRIEPGKIPRPTDQRFGFSMFFQDEMKRWPEYKVRISASFGTGLPYGPPTFNRWQDTRRSPAYRRFDIGFSRELVTDKNRGKKGFGKRFEDGFIAIEVFNLLGINNTINYTWIEDSSGNQYSIPNFLTGRRINVKLSLKF